MIAVVKSLRTELCNFLGSWKRDLRARRDYRNQLDVDAALDIAADLQPVAATAYTAQQADLEAARLIRDSLADGRITPDEIPSLRTALKHVSRSAEADGQITEALA